MSTVVMFKDNTSPSLEDVIRIDGQPVDLTGTQVRFRMRGDTDPLAAYVVDAPATITNAPGGAVRYDWQPADTATEGHYHGWWQVTLSGGNLQDTPDFDVEIVDHTTLEHTTYANTDELFRILKVQRVSEDQRLAAEMDLITATIEIDAEIDLANTTTLTANQLKVAKGVCLDRAADLWRHRESIPGAFGGMDDMPLGPASYGRYSWERYAQRLAPLKDQWGLA
jgi:hypothetical protein